MWLGILPDISVLRDMADLSDVIEKDWAILSTKIYNFEFFFSWEDPQPN